MDRWTQYLFEQHSEAELRAWAKRLKFFRFFRAFGGHANDGDSLNVVFAYQTTSQLESCLQDLGVEVVKFATQPPQPELWVSYRGDEFARFPSLIKGTTWMKQPGPCKIMDVDAFVWCEADRIRITLSDGYTVSEQNVIDAEKIETALARLDLERIDPPKDTKNCICPKYHPDYFTS
ncbi:hypothetical protein NHH82_14640 [Oxalobacteraceae bacterium OTU3REALA1]|nr:hypothetical protein NHH82_14640 [Oxalobacteraceae bacterium OTU3REALA1]